jgi:hypothetical protein
VYASFLSLRTKVDWSQRVIRSPDRRRWRTRRDGTVVRRPHHHGRGTENFLTRDRREDSKWKTERRRKINAFTLREALREFH